MSKQDDGGPAMPVTFKHEHHNGEVTYQEHPGMSLRDYFAAHAPQQVPEGASNADWWSKSYGIPVPITSTDYVGWTAFWTECEARARYSYADALLRARAVDGGGR